MLVFLSCSGERSKSVADELAKWLRKVIQAVEPWIYTDIEKGVKWGPEIFRKLKDSKVGILCVTKENLDSRWILFEAGALSVKQNAYVCTLLLDVEPTDVKQPLAQFEATKINKEDFYRLLQTINRAVEESGERALGEFDLKELYDYHWHLLDDRFKKINEAGASIPMPIRSEREMLQEILELVRSQVRDTNWEPVEVYCRYDECAEQIQGFDNKPRLAKRKMRFTGIDDGGAAVFACPVCGSERRFKERTSGRGFAEIYS